MIFNELGFS